MDAMSPRRCVVALLLAGSAWGQSAFTVVSAASFEEGSVAPESIVAGYGVGLASATEAAAGTDLPESLANVTVRVTDRNGVARLAKLFFVSPGQINFLIPAGTAIGAARVTVLSGGQVVAEGTVPIRAVAPALFSANADGQGVAAALSGRVPQGGTLVIAPIFECPSGRCVPIPVDFGAAGDFVYLSLFGSGIRGRGNQDIIEVYIDGEQVEVLGAAPQGQYPGLDQVNITLPRRFIGRGEVEIDMSVGDAFANLVNVWIGGPVASETPAITVLTPDSVDSGASVPITISGRNLGGVTSIRVPDPFGVRVSNLRASPSSVTAQLNIDADARGDRAIMVAGPAGGSNTLVLRIVTPAPAVTSVQPNRGLTGENVDLTFRGQSLEAADRLECQPSNNVLLVFFRATSTSITARILIDRLAAPGVRKLRVFSPKGLIGEVDFTIEISIPRLVSLSPTFGEPGQTINGFAVTGTGLAGATGLEFTPSAGITVNSFSGGPTEARAQLVIATNAAQGQRQVAALYPGGRSNTLTFEVRPPGPVPRISNLSVDVPTLNGPRTMAIIRGSFNFVDGNGDIGPGATIRVSGGGCPQTFAAPNMAGQTTGTISFQHTYAVTRMIIGNTTVSVTLTDAAGNASNSVSVTRGIWYCP